RDRNVTGVQTCALPIFIGSAVGATVALLLAPKSGRELRQDINVGTKQALERADEWKDVAQEKTVIYTEKAKELGSDWKEKGTEFTKQAVDSTVQFSKDVSDKTKTFATDVADKTKATTKDIVDKT